MLGFALVETVVQHDPGRAIVFQRTLDEREDLYADHHTQWPVHLSVTDGSSPPVVTPDQTINVLNVAPTVSASPITVTVNKSFTVPVGSFTDPGWTPPASVRASSA